tara:strand:+ start:939 stop:1043 length:105 start_codon:yes stop_codon:yes gene_type:complete
MIDKRRYRNAMIGAAVGYVGLILTLVVIIIMAQL